MKPDERLTALETGRNVSFVENMRLRLNSLTGVIRNDAFWTNKGDIAVGKKSREAGKLALGTNGQVITADDTTESGIKWATPSSGGAKSVTLIVGPASNSDSAGYDYTTDGTADEVQIQAAIDALPATGGSVCLREGTYNLAAPVISADNNIHVFGTGSGSIIKGASGWTADGYLFQLDGANCYVDHLTFDGNKAVTELTGSCRWLSNAGVGSVTAYCEFVDSTENNGALFGYIIHSCHITVSPAGAGAISVSHSINQSYITSNSTTGAIIDGNIISTISQCYFVIPNAFDGTVITNFIAVNSNHISIGTTFAGVCISDCTSATGNYIAATSVEGGTGIFDTNNVSDNTITAGSSIDAVANPSTGIQFGYQVNNNHITNFARGIDSASHIHNNLIEGCYLDVIRGIDDRSVVIGNRIETNTNCATDDTYYGIRLNANVDHCVISNNIIKGDSSSNDLKYCISEGTSNDYNIIEHNVCTGADTAQINVVGANTISANNITA